MVASEVAASHRRVVRRSLRRSCRFVRETDGVVVDDQWTETHASRVCTFQLKSSPRPSSRAILLFTCDLSRPTGGVPPTGSLSYRTSLPQVQSISPLRPLPTDAFITLVGDGTEGHLGSRSVTSHTTDIPSQISCVDIVRNIPVIPSSSSSSGGLSVPVQRRILILIDLIHVCGATQCLLPASLLQYAFAYMAVRRVRMKRIPHPTYRPYTHTHTHTSYMHGSLFLTSMAQCVADPGYPRHCRLALPARHHRQPPATRRLPPYRSEMISSIDTMLRARDTQI